MEVLSIVSLIQGVRKERFQVQISRYKIFNCILYVALHHWQYTLVFVD